MIPTKSKSSISQFSMLPSSQTYLAYSKHIHSFLSLPLIPYELLQNGLFIELKQRGYIEEISHDFIEIAVSTYDLLAVEFIELLHWLCSTEICNNKKYIQRILSNIRFHDDENSSTVTLEKIKYYDDNINVPLMLPLPANVLPSRIAIHISNDDLNKKLSLQTLPFDNLLDFYLNEKQKYLLSDPDKIICLFNLISKHWTQIDDTKLKRIKNILSAIKCIPTTQGMKIPKESYIPSPILSSDLALITLNVVQNMIEDNSNKLETSDNRVLIVLLKTIGCRAINVQSYINHLQVESNTTQSSSEQLQMLVQHLLDERINMSDEDIEALQHSKCFPG